MNITIVGIGVYVPLNTTVRIGWEDCSDNTCADKWFAAMSPMDTMVYDESYGSLNMDSFFVMDDPSMFGQPIIIQFDGFRGYTTPLPGPGIDMLLDLWTPHSITAIQGEVIDIPVQSGGGTQLVPEPSTAYILLMLAMLLSFYRKR